MEYALIGVLLLFTVFLFLETRRKNLRVKRVVIEEKRAIAIDSGMTATLGVFMPDTQTTVIIAASEQMGIFYYRMLRQSRVIIKSRLSLANLARIELLINGQQRPLDIRSEQPITSLCATDIADGTISQLTADEIRQIERAALRIIFYDDSGAEKTLEITSFRASDERQRFERVQLLKNTVWWVAFLQLASRNAKRVMAGLGEQAKEEE